MLVRAKTPFTRFQLIIIAIIWLISSFAFPVSIADGGTIKAQKAYSHASLRAMARVYLASGNYDKAQPFLESALDMAKSANAHDADICACTVDLAYLYKSQGKLAEAETMCRTGLELQKEMYGSKHPYVALTLRILSDVYRGQGRYQEAVETLGRAITIMREGASENDPEIAPFKVDMARLLVAKGDLVKAESYFNEALPVIKASYGPNHLYTAKVLTSVAKLYVLQGKHESAEALISKALPIQEKMYGPNHHFLVPAWLIMSRIHQAKGDQTRAKALLEKSLRVAEDQTNPGWLLDVLDAQIDLALKSGDTKNLAKLQRRIDKIRADRHYAYASAAGTLQ